MQSKKTNSPKFFQIKIVLAEVKPSVWRRVLVPGSMTLFKLHKVIQAAMGWTDSHLHQFVMEDRRFSLPSPEDWEPVEDERKFTLEQLVPFEKAQFFYDYDFGDGWSHSLVVEKIIITDSESHARCLAGKRACPPEDVGGVWGYKDFLKAIRDPNHEEHDSYLEWVGGSFDPELCDLAEINAALKRIK
ncbi:MAG: Plasmid pRiA4b ORF-3-like protein [bacterium ADurb.Bin478]|nr:MAG: Plasmid pRiA4b ORF-3-like protein [bacterium ADurb.Bin478]